MMEDELVRIWQSSPNQERVKFDTSRLMLDVQSGIDRVQRLIKYRDLREAIAVVIIIPAFLYEGFRTPFVLSKIACGLVILYAIFVMLRLKIAKKDKPGPVTASYLDYLRKSKKFLTAQKHLLDTVFYWYIIPGYAGVTLYTLGTGNISYVLKMQVLNIILAVATYFMNKRAVQKILVPRLEKIEELIIVLESDPKE